MSTKFTYEELAQRVKELEKQNLELEHQKTKLKNSLERWTQFVENLHEIFYILDLEGKATYVSPNVLNFTGFRPEEIIGRKYTEFVHPEDQRNRPEKLQKILSGGQLVTEARYATKDGGYIWTMTKGSPVFEKGKVTGVQGIMMDISKLKETEETLRESEERFRVLSEATFEGIVIHENGIIIDANKTFAEVFGYEYAEIVGTSVLELAAPEWRDIVKQNILSDFEGAYEATGLRKDGTTFPGELRGSRITYKGRTVRITAVRDLSEQKKIEEELRKSKEKYRVLIENANEAIFVTQDEKMKFTNPQTEEIMGLSKEELTERPFADLLHPADRDMVLDRHRKRIAGVKLPSQYSFRIINAAGELKWIELSTVLFEWEGRPATLNFLRNITQQKELEAQLRQSQKMEAIGTLAGGIAHDFNNILSSVLGYTELSLDEIEEGSTVHQNLSQVITAGNRARDLVKQILTLSRQEEQEFTLVPIVPLVKEILKMLRSTFHSSIELKENIHIDQAIVHGDPTQLRQVIMNLATNAKQALGDEKGVLEVSMEPVSFDDSMKEKHPDVRSGNYVRISVKDTGCGIPEQHLERIFEPYFTTNTTGTGTGLGLSLVHGIVKAHKGNITVHSKPEEGTIFHVELPLIEKEFSQSPALVREYEELPRGNESILLVEDEKPIAEMLEQILSRLGYKVTSRIHSMEALATFHKDPDAFDLLFTDMAMPNLTGEELAKEVKGIRPDLPVILCSGFSEKLDHNEMEDLRIDKIMMKPITKINLAEIVRKTLDEKKSH